MYIEISIIDVYDREKMGDRFRHSFRDMDIDRLKKNIEMKKIAPFLCNSWEGSR